MAKKKEAYSNKPRELGVREDIDMTEYDRREFLKSAGKLGLFAGGYGVVGGFIGRGYEIVRDYINSRLGYLGNKLADLDDRVEKLPNSNPVKIGNDASKEVNSWYERLFKRTPKQQKEWREKHGIKTPEYLKEQEKAEKTNEPNDMPYDNEKKVTRRGFLKSLFSIMNEHPVASGALAGGTYGTGKGAVSNFKGRKIRALKRQNEALRKEVYGLKEREEKNLKDYDEVSREIEEIAESEQGGLEKDLAFIGILGLFASIIFSVTNITGNSIYNIEGNSASIVSAATFILSLIILFISRKV